MAAPLLRPHSYSPEELKHIDILTEKLLHFGEPDFDPSASESSTVGQRDVDPKVKKLVRSHAYTVPLASTSSGASDSVSVKSWNLNEFAYKRDPCPFPTRARGLFTQEGEGKVPVGKGKHRIVARGYDKFFNVGEVNWTKWDTLPDYTQGPYFLTLKTNGCIIFISALTPSQLLITSKHAIGSARTGNLDLSSEYDGPGVDASEAAEEGPEAEEESPAEEEAIASGMPSENDRKSAFEKLTHAGVGEFWLDKHLSSRGLSRADLAKELWDAKVTAVAELTDDSFEEHVLPTPANQTGLVLHGLNRNFAGGVEGDSAQEGKSGGTSELETFDMDVVEAFANKWGFHPTPYKVVPTLDDVRKECERVEKSGWGAEGVMVEGIVVRGSPKSDSPRTTGADKTVKGSKFWKVKFAEPYLMYREWRELTRRLMAERKKLIKEWNGSHPRQKATTDLSDFLRKGFAEKVHVDKMKNPQSRLYVAWLVEQLLTRPQTWFEEWAKGRAIVSTREDFFAWRETDEGKKEAKRLGVSTQDGVDGDRNGVLTDTSDKKADKEFDKTLLVPIAAPGCGKTVLGVALSAYLDSSHTQSDDVTAKKTAAGFVRNVKDLLLKPSDANVPGSRIVFADKNNHLRTHRQAMGELVKELEKGVPQGTQKKAPTAGKKKGKQTEPPHENSESFKVVNTRLVALVWDVESIPQDEFHRLAAARIVERGENHQSLRPERTPEGIEAHEFILWRFLKDFQHFEPALSSEDNAFDDVIEMKVKSTPTAALQSVVERLRIWYPEIPKPTEQNLGEAIDAVKQYKAGVRKKMTLDQKISAPPRYFAIAVPLDLRGYVDDALKSHPNVDRTLFDQLVQNNRFTTVPHMTLLHSQDVGKSTGEEKKEKEAMWEHYKAIASAAKAGESNVEVVLGPRLVWNDRVMAAEVSHVGPEEKVRWSGRTAAHVTIGTIKEGVRPIEGKHLLQAVLDGTELGNSAQVLEIPLQQVKGTIKGLF